MCKKKCTLLINLLPRQGSSTFSPILAGDFVQIPYGPTGSQSQVTFQLLIHPVVFHIGEAELSLI